MIAILASTLFLLTAAMAVSASSKSLKISKVKHKPPIFASGIQCYTIFDKSMLSATECASPRRKFLPRFRAGLIAERRSREIQRDEHRRGVFDEHFDDVGSSTDWAEESAVAEERRKKATEKRVEAAYDAAVKKYDKLNEAKRSVGDNQLESTSKFQFVGVVNDGKGSTSSVSWYARNKPKNSKWNVRLIHVNRDAVLRDLFVKGKVDVYGKYETKGLDQAAFVVAESSGEDVDMPPQPNLGLKPIIQGKYNVKERSLKTLWNFSPRRMFTTPSGSFWRERRIDPGLYTDGTDVYETVFRYRDGKNGLKAVAKFDSFLRSSPGVGQEEKNKVVDRLKGGDIPDLVIEK